MSGERPRFGSANLLAGAGLLGYAWFAAAYGPDPALPGLDLGSLAAGLSGQALWFVPVGILLPLALPRLRGLFTGFFLVLLPSLAIGAVVTTLIVAAPDGAPWRVFQGFVSPDLLALLAPLAGMFAGTLFGVVLARGFGSALMVLPVLAAIAVVLLAAVAVVLLLLTDRVAAADPLGAPGTSDGDFRRAFAAPHPDGAPGSGAALDAATAAAGFRLVLVAAGVDPAVRIEAAPVGETLEVTGSAPLRIPGLDERFLNVRGAAEPEVREGTFRIGLRSLRIAGIEAPPWFVRPSSRVLSRWLRRRSSLAAVVGSFEEIRVEDSTVILRWAEPAEAPPDDAFRVEGYLTLLARDADSLAARADRTAAVVQRAFALASVRSVGGDPVAENRAALLALGGAFGHPSLLDLAGVPGGADAGRDLLERLPLALHGRRDWARHFFLSAGIAQVAPEAFSGGAGLWKERLDAAAGGSGFSFADLLMDESGARLGRVATSDRARARWVQARLAAGLAEADLAPHDPGLPEGLTAERLRSEFGGIGGPEFQRVAAEILRRVDSFPLYDAPFPEAGAGAWGPSDTLRATP